MPPMYSIPVKPGNCLSVSTTSKFPLIANDSPFSNVSANSTAYPSSSVSTRLIAFARAVSSSTIKILAGSVVIRNRQCYGKGAAFLQIGLKSDLASMLFDDCLCDGQSQPATVRLSAEQRLEQPRSSSGENA